MFKVIAFLTLVSFSSYGQIATVGVVHVEPLSVVNVSGIPSSVCTFYNKDSEVINQKLVAVVSNDGEYTIIETDVDMSQVKYISCLEK